MWMPRPSVIPSNRMSCLLQIPTAEVWVLHFSDMTDIKSSKFPCLENVFNHQILVKVPLSDTLFRAIWKKEICVLSRNWNVILCPSVLVPLTIEKETRTVEDKELVVGRRTVLGSHLDGFSSKTEV